MNVNYALREPKGLLIGTFKATKWFTVSHDLDLDLDLV